ncbi:MAG: 16S rRNA (uracil(1498)-N(3))-methyltransferase [Pseudomonadota bacterium]
MTLSRVHVRDALVDGAQLDLPDETGHYVNRVLRLAAGDELIVFNDAGAHRATLLNVKGTHASVQVGAALEAVSASPLKCRLIQGLSRGQRMDYSVQKATELGVQRISPVITARCVVRLDERRAAKRVAHWQAIAVSACEQSGRTDVPVIDPPIRLTALLKDAPTDLAVLDADDGARYADWSLASDSLSLVIGPEGGLTKDETTALIDRGAARWRMGPRVLRTETAGVVALALAQARWGDLA